MSTFVAFALIKSNDFFIHFQNTGMDVVTLGLTRFYICENSNRDCLCWTEISQWRAPNAELFRESILYFRLNKKNGICFKFPAYYRQVFLDHDLFVLECRSPCHRTWRFLSECIILGKKHPFLLILMWVYCTKLIDSWVMLNSSTMFLLGS